MDRILYHLRNYINIKFASVNGRPQAEQTHYFWRNLSELSNFVANTPRTLSSAIIAHVDHEVKRSVLVLNEKSMAAGGTS